MISKTRLARSLACSNAMKKVLHFPVIHPNYLTQLRFPKQQPPPFLSSEAPVQF